MQMLIRFMTIEDGIHGGDSQREMLLINLGFGLQEITKLILLLNTYASFYVLLFFYSLQFCKRIVSSNTCMICFTNPCYSLHFVSLITTLMTFQGESKPFKPYTNRFFVPYKASDSTSPLWYSIKRASAYIIVLSSYSAYGT